MILRLQSASRKRTIRSRLSQTMRWAQQSNGVCAPTAPADIPFDESHVEALAKRLNSMTLTRKSGRAAAGGNIAKPISRKTFDNAFADARFLFYVVTVVALSHLASLASRRAATVPDRERGWPWISARCPLSALARPCARS